MKRICFLVGSVALSGGANTIFQHASFLQSQGYKVILAVQEPFDAQTLTWHDNEEVKSCCVPFDEARQESFDLVIATWWKTALELPNFVAKRYAYFVQSIESRFYPKNESSLQELVDSTYRLPVYYVTEASWIKEHLKVEFGQEADLVRNGIRKDIYKPHGLTLAERNPLHPRILVEGHFNVAFKNTALAIKLARKAGARDIWVLTGSPACWLPGVSRIFSQLPIHKTPEVYRSCDILLKLSTVEGMFGPPLEMFHCGGTAVVFNVTGYDEYIRDGENAVVIPAGDTIRVVSELRRLLDDQERLALLKEKALETAKEWPSWNASSAQFKMWIERTLDAQETDRQAIADVVASSQSLCYRDKKLRLRKDSSIIWRYRLHDLVKKLPHPFVHKLKEILAFLEVTILPQRVR